MLEMREREGWDVLGACEDAASEAEKPRSIQQKSVYRKGDAHRKSHSIQQKVGSASETYKSLSVLVWDVGDQHRIRPLRCTI